MVGGAGRGARVLVVDDDRHSATTLAGLLGAAGFHVACVRSAAAALRAVLHEQVAVVVASFAQAGVGATTSLVTDLRTRPEPALHSAGLIALVDDEADARLGLHVESDVVLVRPVPAQDLVDAVTEVAATEPLVRAARRSVAGGAGNYFPLRSGIGVA